MGDLVCQDEKEAPREENLKQQVSWILGLPEIESPRGFEEGGELGSRTLDPQFCI